MLHRDSFIDLGLDAEPEPIAPVMPRVPITTKNADPIDRIRGRLDEIDARLPSLREMHQLHGDAMAGRLLASLERERDQILARVAATGGNKILGNIRPATSSRGQVAGRPAVR